MPKLKFILKKSAKGFFYSIESSNGNNLNPADPQKQKAKVKNAIKSLIIKVRAGDFTIVDETKAKKK